MYISFDIFTSLLLTSISAPVCIAIPIGMLFMMGKKVLFGLITTIRNTRHPEEEVEKPINTFPLVQ